MDQRDISTIIRNYSPPLSVPQSPLSQGGASTLPPFSWLKSTHVRPSSTHCQTQQKLEQLSKDIQEIKCSQAKTDGLDQELSELIRQADYQQQQSHNLRRQCYLAKVDSKACPTRLQILHFVTQPKLHGINPKNGLRKDSHSPILRHFGHVDTQTLVRDTNR